MRSQLIQQMRFDAIRDRVQEIGSDLFKVSGLIYLFGKVCIVVAVYCALKMGVAFRDLSNFSLPDLRLSEVDNAPAEKKNLELAQYKIIADRNLFGTKAAAATQAPIANIAQLKMRLVGTTVGKTGRSAILEDLNKNEQDVFTVEEQAFGRAKLVDIRPQSVRIQYNGKIETLILDGGSAGAETAEGPSGPPDDTQTDFTVPEQELNEALNNLPLLLSQARAVPYFRNGQSIGMRLFAIRRDSMYEKLGLKNGDILTNVNESSLSDPSQALKLFEQLKNERRIQVKLERNGESKDLNYSIR